MNPALSKRKSGMNIRAIRTRVFKEGDDLVAFVTQHVSKLKEGSVLVVTSKIVALAEGAVVQAPTSRAKNALIRAESEWQLEAKYGKITLKDGLLMWNAGIDESNAKGNVILLPRDSFTNARNLRLWLLRHYHIKKLGVVITDSRVLPLRAGVVGVALGYAGFKGLRDYRGTKDIFGRKLRFAQTDIADSLATAATLTMGEGREQRPLCVIEDAPVGFCEKTARKELLVAPKDDMYRPLFKKVRTQRPKRRE
jgi:coenzyme F420-0:L-glutamate ligase